MKIKTANSFFLVFFAALLAVGLWADYAQAGIRRIWAVDDGEKIKREDIANPLAVSPYNAVWNGSAVSLFGCKNEVVAFQLMLEGDASGQTGVNMRITNLGNGVDTIPGSQAGSSDPYDYRGKSIELFTEHYLNITSKSPAGWFYHYSSPPSDYYLGWVPDALIPFAATPGRGGAPFAVPANQNQGVWVDIYIPRNVSAGIYTGSIEVLVNAAVVQTIPISLEVYDFALPDETHLQNMFAYSSWGSLCQYAHGHNDDYSNWYYENLDMKYRQMAHRHRMTLARAIINLERMSSYDIKYLNGQAFTAANNYAGPGEGVGDSSFCIGPYGYRPQEWGGPGGTQAQYWAGTNAWEQWFRDNAPAVYRFHQVSPDEPQTPAQYEQVKTECNWMHNNPGIGKNIACMVTHEVIADLQGYIDFWCFWGMGLLPGNVNLAGIEYEKSIGKKIGVYNSGRPSMGTVLIDSDAVDFRVNPWVFKKYGIAFYFYYETTNWTAVNCFQDPRTYGGVYNGDGTFFYPGQCVHYPEEDRGLPGPMSSIRMKNWRRGQQDYEYIWLAEQYGLQSEVNQIINNCVPRAAWEAVPAQNIAWSAHGYGFDIYRRQMAEIITNAMGQIPISGTVTYNSSGLAGVVMSGLPGNPVTNASGKYTAKVVDNWSGTVTPTLAGYRFNPANRTYTNVTTDQSGQDYAASTTSYAKNDFNGDGQEDILWRYYGGGPWQGWNAVWFLSQGSGSSAMASGMKSQGLAPRELFPAPGPNKKYRNPLEAGGLLSKRPEKIRRDASEAADLLKYKGEWQIDADDFKKVRIVKNPGEIGAGIQERIRTAGLVTSGSAYLDTVADLNWDIAGTGDFNGDGKTDILWRYYGSGSNQGANAVWYMNGVNYIGASMLMTITDTNWRIESTGDFNGDGKPDILWRYYGGGPNQGRNVIWYMDGANYIGAAMLITITDTNWRIEGTGDFNGDGKTDILWRYYGGGANQGKNAVWYMNGATYIGVDMLITVADTNWRIEGTRDFNGDGKTDIIWRYYGGDSNLGMNAVWYMNGANYIGAAMLDTVADANWRIKNR